MGRFVQAEQEVSALKSGATSDENKDPGELLPG
jgi:hypothetical protein